MKLTKSCVLAVGLSLLLILSLTGEAAQVPDHERAEVTSTIVRVSDGDTIKLANDMEVRYLGLDTPETHHLEKPVEYFAVKASKFNKQLVGGKKVKLEYDVQKDRVEYCV